MIEVGGSNLFHLDLLLFYFFNLQLANPILDFLMPIITCAGTQLFWIIVCLILIIFGGKKGRYTAYICLIALVAGYFASELLKYLIARPRPFEVLQGARHLVDMTGYALPSGHATAAFTGFTILSAKYGYVYIFIPLAILVAISRVYLGVHYPSDILAGALLGVVCALVVLRYEEKLLSIGNKILNRKTHKNLK